MDRTTALGILQSLADGIHPATGQTMPAESPCQHPEVIRALFHAVHALRATLASSAPGVQVAATETSGAAANAPTPAPVDAPSSPPAPPRRGAGNSGKPWTKDEDEQLVTGFDAGQPVAALAQAHGRSKVAIEARLAKFGRVPMPTGLRSAPRAEESRAKYAARA
jgi:hypothetical protein